MAFFQQARRMPFAGMPQQQVFSPQPRPGLLMPQFGGGMAGGGIAGFLQPLAQYLRQEVGREQVDPFIQEVAQMAQQKFNLQGSGSNPFAPNPLQQLAGIASLFSPGGGGILESAKPTVNRNDSGMYDLKGNPMGEVETVMF